MKILLTIVLVLLGVNIWLGVLCYSMNQKLEQAFTFNSDMFYVKEITLDKIKR